LDAQQQNNLLSNPTQYINLVAGIDQVFLRITTEFDCFQIIKLDLIVSTTLIPVTLMQKFPHLCQRFI